MKILYRVVAALGALTVFPILYFQKLIRIVIDMGFMDGYFDDALSISRAVDFFKQNGAPDMSKLELTERLAEVLAPMKGWAISALVFACIFIAMVLAVFFCSACTNAKKVNLIFSVIGAVSVIGTISCFNSMTDMIISGQVPLGDIINAVMADSGSALAAIGALLGLGNAVSIIGEPVIIQLGNAFVLSLFVFIFEAVWTLSFILIGLDTYKAPKVPKKKGE